IVYRAKRPEPACPACPGRACPELLVLSLSKGSKGPGEFIEWVEGFIPHYIDSITTTTVFI
ncbi:MAG: hypothetical protein WBF29_18540, partial [Syntrophobacteria bacterium]